MNSYRFSCGFCAWQSIDMLHMQRHVYDAHACSIHTLQSAPTSIVVCLDGTIVRAFTAPAGQLVMRVVQPPQAGPPPWLLRDNDEHWWNDPLTQVWHHRTAIHHGYPQQTTLSASQTPLKSTDYVCAQCAADALADGAYWEQLHDPCELQQWLDVQLLDDIHWYGVALCDEIDALVLAQCQTRIVLEPTCAHIIIAHHGGDGSARTCVGSTWPLIKTRSITWTCTLPKDWSSYSAVADATRLQLRMAAAMNN